MFLTVLVLPGVHVDAKHPVTGYLVLAALFGVLNAIIKPLLQFLALPFLLQSLGAVVIVVDIAVFALLDALTPTLLQTEGALWIAAAGLLLGFLSFLLENLVGLTPPIVTDRPSPEAGGTLSRPSYKDRFHERQRLMQVYDVFLRYGAEDGLFDRGALGDFRRFVQGRLYGVHMEPLSAPEKARLMLQELGPTYVKLGQIVSSRADALPSDWEAELSKLQSDVRPFPVEQAREVIASELGAPPEELYESFDPKPLAAASLGQVHRATLEGGRRSSSRCSARTSNSACARTCASSAARRA